MHLKKHLLLLCLSLLIVGLTTAQSRDKKTEKKLKTLDEQFAKAITDFNVPGMAIAMVIDDKVVLSKGYGVKSVTTKEPVDENSLFAIASNTKAFTSAALAILVDQGKISWNDKVRKYLPYFSLYDPFVSEEMTIRDLLCHRSGLQTFSGDLVWYGTGYTREEVIKKASLLQPVFGFRETWGYNNIMFIAAGEIVTVVSGKSWDVFVRENFFNPLGMQRTNTSVNDLKNIQNVAMPHNEVNGVNKEIEYLNWDNTGGAGAINSSVAEMSQWLRLQLGKGQIDGKRIWNEDRSWEMWENQMARPVSAWQRNNMPSRHFNGYALGWELMDYGGFKIVSHSGGYDGMISRTVLVPELKLGFVILTNNINSLPSVLSYTILDQFTGPGVETDWLALFLNFKKEDEEAVKQEREAAEKSRIADTRPSLALEKYAGTYSSELYGDVVIKTDATSGGLLIDFVPTPLFKGKLSHWHYDTFELKWTTQMMLPPGKATFVLDAAGRPTELRIDVPNPDFDFTELHLFRKD